MRREHALTSFKTYWSHSTATKGRRTWLGGGVAAVLFAEEAIATQADAYGRRFGTRG